MRSSLSVVRSPQNDSGASSDNGQRTTDNVKCQLYLITPPTLDLASFTDVFQRACDAGPVASLQLRLKDANSDAIKRAAEALLPLCQARNIAFILNDNPALALEVGADGVHLGRDDMPVKEARALVGEEMVIGASCYDSTHLAMQAGENGADYVAFGAFFPSQTKDPPAQANIELLEGWSRFAALPCVAIGGITPQNCRLLVEAGADFLAVCGSVWSHPNGPEASVKAFTEILTAER